MVPIDGADEPVTTAELVHITTVPMSLNFLRGQVGFMQARGLRVHAISSPGPELSTFAQRESASVSAIRMERRITPLRDIVAIVRLARRLARTRPLIVHAHTPKGGLLGMVAAALRGVPVRVYHMRGLPLMGATGIRRRLLWLSEWVSCRLAHRVICVSHSLRQEAVAAGICSPERIQVLLGGSGNGVDSSGRFDPVVHRADRHAVRARYGIPAGATVIGFVGRIVRDKGIVELAEAWRKLREEYPDLHLLLVGFFESQDPIPAATEAVLRDDPRVHLTGLDWDVAPYYAAMDVVALPTYREGFPNVPLEAAAMGLPVVATRIPGCVDAIADEVTGVLVPPRDALALSGALRRYLDDSALRARHGTAGRARVVTEFRQEAIWGALLDEYRALLAQRSVPFTPAAGLEPQS